MASSTVPAHGRAELRIFYVVVLVLALFGQSSGASSWLIPPDANQAQTLLYWLLVFAFVAVLELGAVVLLRRAETQRRAGKRAWIAILTAIVLAVGAAALSWAGHWGPEAHEKIQAWAFSGSTLLGVVVWAIMADLSIAEHVSQRRAVRDAVRRYVKSLTMDNAEKAVLIATMNIPLITKWILDGPGAVEGQGHERDLRIAAILATAIDPDTWHGLQAPPQIEAVPEPVATVAAPKPAAPKPQPKPQQRSIDDTQERDAKFLKAWKRLIKEHAAAGNPNPPSCRELGDAAGYGKSTASKWIAANKPELEGVSA